MHYDIMSPDYWRHEMSQDLRKMVKNLNNRVGKIELQFKKFGVENLNFLIGNLRIQAEQIQSLQFTIGIQQKYIEGKGLKAEYEEWLQKEINMLNRPPAEPEGGQDHDGKIERVSRTEKGKGRIGGHDKDSRRGAEGKNKDTSEPNKGGDEGTPVEPKSPKQPDSGSPK